MSNVLKRKMFNTPKYEHKSTGIASGLEYRPGYKTGGRVGFSNGGGAYDLPFDPLPGMGPIQPNITPSNNPPLSPHGDFDVSPTPPVTDEVIANINPDLLTETKQDYLTTPDPLTESQRIAKLLMGEIPGTDFSKYAIDFDKYAVIPKDQLDIINQYVSILDRQLGLLQRVLNVNGLHDSYYNEGIQMTLKNIRIDTVKTEGSTVDHIEVKGNDKKVVY